MVLRKCESCGKEFKTKPYMIKKGFGRFCSRACSYENMRTGKEVACHTCGKPVYRTPRRLKIAKNKKYFCDKKCQTKWRNTVYVGPRHASWKHGRNAYHSVLKRVGRKQECQLCKLKDKRLLVTHHIDRNKENNNPENLVWLCPNCHFLLHHYNVGADEGLLK